MIAAAGDERTAIAGFKKVKENTPEGGLLFVASCGHTERGSIILVTPLEAIEAILKEMPGRKIFMLDTCHSGLALDVLKAADAVYAAGGPDDFTGGIFFQTFLAAISDPSKSDTNGDGKVSMAEAWAYGPAFWSGPTGPLPQRRATGPRRSVRWDIIAYRLLVCTPAKQHKTPSTVHHTMV